MKFATRTAVIPLLLGAFLQNAALAGQKKEATEIVVLPKTIHFDGNWMRQQLIVEKVGDKKHLGEVRKDLVWKSSDKSVVEVVDGIAFPRGNGKAVVTASFGKHTAKSHVEVRNFEKPHTWNFSIHVQPILTKAGCNSGACHGARAGKNGFKLSLRGYDSVADFETLTRRSRGRRIVPADPGRSLFLTKPTRTLPHKGGKRFEVNSPQYKVLSQWIAEGQPAPTDRDPVLTTLEVLPKSTLLKKRDLQQILVRAHFSDGHVEDVTHEVRFTSTNRSVAKCNNLGLVEVTGHGDSSIVAAYLSRNIVAKIVVPFETKLAENTFETAERHNFIDDYILTKLEELNLPPSPMSSDSEFLRRVFLDTIGVLPTVEETEKFLKNRHPDKRLHLIDRLLKRPEFVDYWTYKWSDLLLVTGTKLNGKARDRYYAWIRKRVEQNTPWDEFVSELITASGNTATNGATNFYVIHQDPREMAETVSMAFMGLSINCARCHNHPLEKWTNNQYYGMANMFSRVRAKNASGGQRVIFSADRGELIQPSYGRPQPPRPLDAKAIPFADTTDRRVAMAQWLVSPKNPYFTKAIVNRIWANFFGMGIVDKVDDLRLTNPPSNPELFEALANDLIEYRYNLKHLIRLILRSAAYQRSSRILPENAGDSRYFSHYFPKRLQSEILLDAISQVTEKPTKFSGYKEGTRALQLRDVNVGSYFLKTFGRPQRAITCECERSNEPSMTQVLHILNGKTINDKLSHRGNPKKKIKENRLGRLLRAQATPTSMVDEAYLAALCRYPTAKEKRTMTELLTKAKGNEKRLVLEDIFWSLLSSKEFLFNH